MNKLRHLVIVICLGFVVLGLGFVPKVSAICSCTSNCDISGNQCKNLNAKCLPLGATSNCTGCTCPDGDADPLPSPTSTNTPIPTNTSVPVAKCEDMGFECVSVDRTGPLCISRPYNCAPGLKCVTDGTKCTTVFECISQGFECVSNSAVGPLCITRPYACPVGNKCVSDGTKCSPPTPSTISPSCCLPKDPSNTFCATIRGNTLKDFYDCTIGSFLVNCYWRSSATCFNFPTPIPTKPIPKVFCKPGADVSKPGNTSNNPNDKGIATNIGCIPYETDKFANSVLSWGVSIGGGITFLVIVYAAFLYVSSGGDPKKVQAAKEMIVALLGGFGLIIFGIILLNYLGVDLLGLSDLGFSQ